MKRILLFTMLAMALLAGFAGWLVVGPATAFHKKTYTLLIRTGSTYNDVLKSLKEENVISNPAIFNLLAKQVDYQDKVKAGRYIINKGNNLVNILRKLRNGQQDAVNLVITKLRTREDFASLAGKKFEFDSIGFIHFPNNAFQFDHGLFPVSSGVFFDFW